MANRLSPHDTGAPMCVDIGPRAWTMVEPHSFDDLVLTRCAMLPDDASGIALLALRGANFREAGRTPFSVGRYRDLLLISTRLSRGESTQTTVAAARGDLVRFQERCMRASGVSRP